MKIYITFGQGHIHNIDGKVFDKDCVAVLEADSEQDGRIIAQEHFGDEWFTTYTEEYWSDSRLIYFPRGYLELN